MSSYYGDTDDDRDFLILRNDEDQYSIWPTQRELPEGWHAVGEPAKKAECLSRIEELWTDMRPRSLREELEQQGQ